MELLSIKEASERYNLPAYKIREFCITGKIPAAKFGVSWRIGRASLEKYLDTLLMQNMSNSLKVPKCDTKVSNFKAELKKLRGNP